MYHHAQATVLDFWYLGIITSTLLVHWTLVAHSNTYWIVNVTINFLSFVICISILLGGQHK